MAIRLMLTWKPSTYLNEAFEQTVLAFIIAKKGNYELKRPIKSNKINNCIINVPDKCTVTYRVQTTASSGATSFSESLGPIFVSPDLVPSPATELSMNIVGHGNDIVEDRATRTDDVDPEPVQEAAGQSDEAPVEVPEPAADASPPKKRGRPKGSKNKPKPPPTEAAV